MLQFGFLAFALLSSVCALTRTEIIEYTCFWYKIMDEHQNIIQINCNSSDVFDPAFGRCVDPTDGNWPCTDVQDCSNLPDKKYADVNTKNPEDRCKTYYTCHNGYFYGHNYCPGVLIFNEEYQICDWVYNVKPPCGTAKTDVWG